MKHLSCLFFAPGLGRQQLLDLSLYYYSGYPATVCGSQLNFPDEVQGESDGRVCDLVKHDDFGRSVRKSRERR